MLPQHVVDVQQRGGAWRQRVGAHQHVGHRAESRSAHRSARRSDERARGNLEPSCRLEHAAVREVRRPDELRSRLHGPLCDSGELRGLPDLGHLEPRASLAQDRLLLPRVAERCVGLQESAVRVRRGAYRPSRLRWRGREGHRQQGAPARAAHLRHHGHRESEERRQRADVPRLAHAHRRRRSEGSGQRVRLHLRLRPGAIGQGAPGLRGHVSRARIQTPRSSVSK